MPELDPSQIMQVGMGFFASKTLLSAVELGLFTELAKRPMTGAEIVRTLGLNPRAVPDFPDALVALKFLHPELTRRTGLVQRFHRGIACPFKKRPVRINQTV